MGQFTIIRNTVTMSALRTSDATPSNLAREVVEFCEQHNATVELYYADRLFRVKPTDTVEALEEMLVSWTS